MGMGLVFPVLPAIFSNHYNPFLLNEGSLHFYYCATMMIVPIGWTISGVIMGYWSDIYGRKNIILISLFASSLSYGLCVLALQNHLLWLFILARLIIGLGSGSFSLVQTVMTDIAPKDKLARYMGWVNAASAIGFVSGSLITLASSNQLDTLNFSTPFIFGCLISFINFMLVYLTVYESNTKQSKTSNWLRFSLSTELKLLFIMFIQLEIAWGLFLQSSPIILHHTFNTPTYYIALYYLLNGMAAMLCILFIQPLFEKRFSYEKTSTQISAIAGILMFAIFNSNNYVSFTCIMFFMTIFEFLLFTSLLYQISKLAPHNEKGKIMGVVSSLIGLSFIISDVIMLVTSEQHVIYNILYAAILFPLYGTKITGNHSNSFKQTNQQV